MDNICTKALVGDFAGLELAVREFENQNPGGWDWTNQFDSLGSTPLASAAVGGSVSCLSLVLGSGALPEVSRKDGLFPLYLATVSRNTEAVATLLRFGARVDHTDHLFGRTALHKCCRIGHLEIARILLATGADLNKADKDGVTPLIGAARSGNTQLVQLLLDLGADKHAVAGDGSTAFGEAVFCGYAAVAELLRD